MTVEVTEGEVTAFLYPEKELPSREVARQALSEAKRQKEEDRDT